MSLAGLYMLVQMFGWETVLDPDALMEAMDNFMKQYLNSMTTGGGSL